MMENLVVDNTHSLTINMFVSKAHLYRCPKGHEWKSADSPFIVFSVGDVGHQQAIKVAVCVLCLGEAAKRRFPVEDMGEVDEGS